MSLNLNSPIFKSEAKAREHLEAQRWPEGPICPHCGSIDDATKLEGEACRPGLYQCNASDCREQFTVTVGTVFERSKVPLHKWLLATFLLSSSKKGMSAHQLHRTLGVTYKTAWFMFHRIREAMTPAKGSTEPMGGEGKVIEADETYMGKRLTPSGPSTFRSNVGWQSPPPYATQRKIVALVERGGPLRSFVVERVDGKTIKSVLLGNADRKSELMSDDAPVYQSVGRQFTEHFSVNHSEKEYVRDRAHTNTIEGAFSIFKRGMVGVYQHCGEQHLQRYLNEFDFRYSNRAKLGIDDAERTNRVLKGIEGKRLTYRRPHGAALA